MISVNTCDAAVPAPSNVLPRITLFSFFYIEHAIAALRDHFAAALDALHVGIAASATFAAVVLIRVDVATPSASSIHARFIRITPLTSHATVHAISQDVRATTVCLALATGTSFVGAATVTTSSAVGPVGLEVGSTGAQAHARLAPLIGRAVGCIYTLNAAPFASAYGLVRGTLLALQLCPLSIA